MRWQSLLVGARLVGVRDSRLCQWSGSDGTRMRVRATAAAAFQSALTSIQCKCEQLQPLPRPSLRGSRLVRTPHPKSPLPPRCRLFVASSVLLLLPYLLLRLLSHRRPSPPHPKSPLPPPPVAHRRADPLASRQRDRLSGRSRHPLSRAVRSSGTEPLYSQQLQSLASECECECW